MTDHSILTPGLPELPFQEEARLITRIISFFGTKAPQTLATAVAARNLFEAVSGLDDEQIAELGIDRTGIARYAAEKSGVITF